MWAAAAAAAAAADLAAEIAAVNAKFDAIALDARNEMKAALTALDRLAAARRRSKPSTPAMSLPSRVRRTGCNSTAVLAEAMRDASCWWIGPAAGVPDAA